MKQSISKIKEFSFHGLFLVLLLGAVHASAQTNSTADKSPDVESAQSAGIVGLWDVKFVSVSTPGIPDGTVIDHALVTWHADGTEIMNSGRPAISSNFCMGVWKQIGRRGYKLNHYAKAWDMVTGTTYVGPANIKEDVVLNRFEDRYSGTFILNQYDTNGNVLAHVTGILTGVRITVD
jgi:hypothetical protein